MDDLFVVKKCEICGENSHNYPLCKKCYFGLSKEGLGKSLEGFGKSQEGLITICGKCGHWKEDDKLLCYNCWLEETNNIINSEIKLNSEPTAQINIGEPENIRHCIYCSNELNVKSKIINFPERFSVYLCPKCGCENEGWILNGMDKYTIQNRHLPDCYIESVIRALFLDVFLQNKEIYCVDVHKYIKERYKEEYKKDIELDEYDCCRDLERLYKGVISKDISTNPFFFNIQHGLISIKFTEYTILENFFNKRIIRQWDLKHLTTDLIELKEKIKINENIRYKDRWLKAIDYFIDLKR